MVFIDECRYMNYLNTVFGSAGSALTRSGYLGPTLNSYIIITGSCYVIDRPKVSSYTYMLSNK